MSVVERKWYVLRAVSGKESKVKEFIEAEMRNTDLGEYVFQVLIPTEKSLITSMKPSTTIICLFSLASLIAR